MRADERHETRPYLRVRRAYVDVLDAGRRKNLMHGLLQLDVTEARRLLARPGDGTAPLSFTGWVLHCVAAAVDADRTVHAYRRRNRLVLFADVDVSTQIEAEVAGQKVVKSLIVRAANRKSVRAISDEIRAAQDSRPQDEHRYRGTLSFLTLPRFARRLGWRVAMGNPRWFKRFGGTIGLSSVGMFGAGGGWGIVSAPPTLMVVIGGISTEPRVIDGRLQDRELLHLTLTLDHAIVDGAPAARFAAHLGRLIETAHGLTTRPEPVAAAAEATRTDRG
jgi:pyruvate/2-oxoglutarate dehydrogenase complex dihydrolipoamide acyltransferase (E2) component